jgi:hypothetical protein
MEINSATDLKRIARKNKILARFKMGGCHYCEETQQDWNQMCNKVKHKLSPDSVITEIDSNFTNDFLNTIKPVDQTGQIADVQGYPTYMVIVNGRAIPHHGRSKNELLKTLMNHHMLLNSKRSRRPTSRHSRRSKRNSLPRIYDTY